MTDSEMLEKARIAGYKKRHLSDPSGTHTICRHGMIEKNGKKKHKCIRYALVSAQHGVQPTREAAPTVGNSDQSASAGVAGG